MMGVCGRRWIVVTCAFMLPVCSACATVPLRAHAQYRREQYLAARPEVSTAVANAIATGHVITGMNQEQVWVVLGDAVRKAAFSDKRVEVWLYPAVRFHQDPAHSHGASSFRLVFVDGVLRVIEPI